MSSYETKKNVRRWFIPATRTVVTIGLLALISQLSAQKLYAMQNREELK